MSPRVCRMCQKRFYPRAGDGAFKSCAGCRVKNKMMTVYRLVVWAAQQAGTLDPYRVTEKLTCESMRVSGEPKGGREAITVFRHLRAPARLSRVKSTLKQAFDSNDPAVEGLS